MNIFPLCRNSQFNFVSGENTHTLPNPHSLQRQTETLPSARRFVQKCLCHHCFGDNSPFFLSAFDCHPANPKPLPSEGKRTEKNNTEHNRSNGDGVWLNFTLSEEINDTNGMENHLMSSIVSRILVTWAFYIVLRQRRTSQNIVIHNSAIISRTHIYECYALCGRKFVGSELQN